MCGIIGAVNFDKNKDNVNEWILNQFEDQFTRGSKGLGAIVIDEDRKIKVLRATEPLKMFFDLHLNPSRMILFHHRFPTSSDNKLKQTHPIKVENAIHLKFKYLVMHNGIIDNEDTIKEEHEKLSFRYTTYDKKEEEFNDSECFAIEIARFIEKGTKEVGTTGSAAFIALQIDTKTDKATKIFFGKDGINPLNMSMTRGKLRLSSEGEGSEIKENILYSFDLKTHKLAKSKMIFKKVITPTYSYLYAPGTLPVTGYQNNNKFDWKGYFNKKKKDEINEDYPDVEDTAIEVCFKASEEMREKLENIIEIFMEENAQLIDLNFENGIDDNTDITYTLSEVEIALKEYKETLNKYKEEQTKLEEKREEEIENIANCNYG